jgi:hypothetical protein
VGFWIYFHLNKQGIPFWRHVNYTDDGCDLYQCLSCKYTWESRTSPNSYDGKQNWRFCPVCGCEWEGEKKTPYLRGGKHEFVIRVHGRDDEGYSRPSYRYQVLQWCEYQKRWSEVADWYVSNRDFYLVPVGKVRLCGAYKRSSRGDALEKVAEVIKSDQGWKDEIQPIKIILERREQKEKKSFSRTYMEDYWVPVSEFFPKIPGPR